jgi:hypothetical protein
MMGKTMKGRFTEKIISPTEYEFKFEVSMDGGEFANILEGKATKSGARAESKTGGAKATGAAAEKGKTGGAKDASAKKEPKK